jgi:hypothetical protein
MHTYSDAIRFIGHAFTGRGLRSIICSMGVQCPADSTAMYLRGETPEYLHAAALACMTVGA